MVGDYLRIGARSRVSPCLFSEKLSTGCIHRQGRAVENRSDHGTDTHPFNF